MAGSCFLDKTDPGSWRALNSLALKVPAAAEAEGLSPLAVELPNAWVPSSTAARTALTSTTGWRTRPQLPRAMMEFPGELAAARAVPTAAHLPALQWCDHHERLQPRRRPQQPSCRFPAHSQFQWRQDQICIDRGALA